jgi:spermidine/putrescine transport system substrate-binding protein
MNDLIKGVLDARLHTPMNRRRFIQGASGLATLTVLGAPRSAHAEIGGPLNFFGYDGEQGANVTKDFLAKNGIEMNAAFAGAADETLTRFKTGGRGSMDIMTMNKDFQRSVIDAKVELFQPLDLARIPNAAGLFAGFKDANWLVRDGETYGVPMIWGDEPCIWNPQKWDGVPDRYTDFADPKYKGELVLLDDPFGNIWLFAKSVGVKDPSRLTKADLDRAVEAMLTIKPNVVAIGASLGDMADIMIRGDASMGLGGWAYQTIIAKEKGVELVVGSPKIDDRFFWSDAYTIAVDAPNLDNAYAFIDFITSPEANAQLATELGSGCTVEKAYGLLDPGMQKLYDYEHVRQPGAGILGAQTVVPKQEPDGDIVGAQSWVEAWQAFKVA